MHLYNTLMAMGLDRRTNKAYVSLGSNLGNRKKKLSDAVQMLQEKVGSIIDSSAIYETESWGNENLPSFYNQVICISTTLSATELMKTLLQIEEQMGRKRKSSENYSSRTLDLDVIYYNNEVISEEHLQIPHPHLHKRNFVLLPLMEIARDFVHPIFNKNTAQLVAECTDTLTCRRTL